VRAAAWFTSGVRARSTLPFAVALGLLASTLGAGLARATPPQAVTLPEPPRDIRLVYTGTLVLDVEQVEAALTRVEEVTHGEGGYLSSRTEDSIVVRVPQARFREALAELSKVGEVVHREIEAKDASRIVVDVDARLRNARAVRDRLAELLHAAPAARDVVAIERELGRVMAEIEDLQGSPHVIADRLAYPAITVTFGRAHAACDSPFTYDEHGLKHFKSECL
jgi:hypothetical protein